MKTMLAGFIGDVSVMSQVHSNFTFE